MRRWHRRVRGKQEACQTWRGATVSSQSIISRVRVNTYLTLHYILYLINIHRALHEGLFNPLTCRVRLYGCIN